MLTVGERKVRPRAHRARARRTPAFVPYKGLQSFGETAATAPLKTIPVAKVNLQGKLGGRLRMAGDEAPQRKKTVRGANQHANL